MQTYYYDTFSTPAEFSWSAKGWWYQLAILYIEHWNSKQDTWTATVLILCRYSWSDCCSPEDEQMANHIFSINTQDHHPLG